MNDNDLTYLDLAENSPKIKNTNSDLLALIEETENIHEFVQEDIEELHTPWVIFSQVNELEPTDLVEEESTQTEPPHTMSGCLCSSTNRPLNIHPR